MEDLIKRSDATEVVYKALRTPPLKGVLTDTMSLAVALVQDIPSADRPQGWIPCSERSPIGSGKYLVQATNHNGIGSYMEVVTYQSQNWMMDGVAVAWMPLPEPWEGASR